MFVSDSRQNAGADRTSGSALEAVFDLGRMVLKLVALLILLVYLPALMVIALAVLFTSPGPAFVNRCYRREDGRMVDLWEFRTECWQRWEPTPVGRYLRGANMHRLPSLVNVLRGDIRVGERVRVACDWT